MSDPVFSETINPNLFLSDSFLEKEYVQSAASTRTEELLRPFALYIQIVLLIVAFTFGYIILKQLQKEDEEFETMISSRIQDQITENPQDKDLLE